MGYRVVEVGYKVVKFGKHAASCSLSSLAPGRLFLNGGIVLAGVLALGATTGQLAQAQQVLPDDIALKSNLAGDINGQLGGGYLISNDARFGGSRDVTIGTTDLQSLVYNFDTRGGNGSGGGAGLGGVFFVDKGASLTVINSDFVSNRVQGGQGGSDPALRFADRMFNVTGQTVELPALLSVAQFTDSSLSFTETTEGGYYSFKSLQASSDIAKLLKPKSLVSFENYNVTDNLAEVLSNGIVRFEEDIRIDHTDVTAIPANRVTFASRKMSITESFTTVIKEIDDVPTVINVYSTPDLSGLTIGSSIVARVGSVANQLAEITEIEFWSEAEDTARSAGGTLQGKIKSVTLSKAVVLEPTDLTNIDIVKAPDFNSAQFFVNDGAIKVTSPVASFSEGMTVTWVETDEDDFETTVTATVAKVESDGSIRLDKPLPSGVLEFTAVQDPILGPNELLVADASSKFKVDQLIFVPGDDGVAFSGMVTAIQGDRVTVKPLSGGALADHYDAQTGLAIKTASASVGSGGSAITVQFDTSSRSAADIAKLFSGRNIEGEAFGDDGMTVTSVSIGNGEVTLSLSGTVDASEPITYFKVISPRAIGGNMNDLAAPANTTGQDGGDGFSANWFSTFFAEGEGVDGTNGAPAREGDVGIGFNGGDGGNGSAGHPVNFFLAYDLTASLFGLKSATLDLKVALLEMADAPIPEPVVGAATALPKPTELVKAIANLTKSKIDLAFVIGDVVLATTNVTYWGVQLGTGLAGLGGAGGDGGEASGGADFFGGGKGGAGGDGGAGALSFTDGGDGGSGGRGGDGGFGAGGGMGGAGGEAGDNGNAAGGDPGDGGFAGFGAGDGANGNGMFGGGGSGLGGAIFVREGGRLLITGDALFELNYVSGGTTTSQFGEAGIGVGSDIFMMKGSDVELAPGRGNEIRFEGDIADDSLATNDGFMNAAGDGADLVISGGSGNAGGLVVFNGANTYSGNTVLQGATLTAEVGVGVSDSSLLRFNGAGTSSIDTTGNLSLGSVGTFLLQHDYVRRAGMDPFETAWTGSGGFASGMVDEFGAPVEATVTLGRLDGGNGGKGQDLEWNFDGFFVTAPSNGRGSRGVLTFGSEMSTSSVRFTNNVDLNGFGAQPGADIGRVAVYRNLGEAGIVFETSNATLSGNWTNGGLLIGDANPQSAYRGTLFMTGANRLDNLLIAGGRLSTFSSNGSAGRLMDTDGDIIVNVDANLDSFGMEAARSATVEGANGSAGIWTIANETSTTGDVVNKGIVYLLGSKESTHIEQSDVALTTLAKTIIGVNYIDQDFAGWRGALNVGGNITNDKGAELWQAGRIDVDGNAGNLGTWTGNGSLDVAGNLGNAGNMIFDAGTSGVVQVTGNLVNSGNWVQNGQLSVGQELINHGEVAEITQAGKVNVTTKVTNDGSWSFADSSSITATALEGTGRFILSATEATGDDPTVEDTTILSLDLAQNSVFGGIFEGPGSLVKAGSGLTTLSSDQEFSGTLTVDAGGIVAEARMHDDLDIVIGSGGTYTANTADVVNSVRNSGTMTLNGTFTTKGKFENLSPTTLYLNTDLSTISGDVDNPGRIVVEGNRVMDIGTGEVGGPVALAGLTGSDTGVIEILDGGSLTVTQRGNTTYNGVINPVNVVDVHSETALPPARFVKDGTGALTLTGVVQVLDIDIAQGDLRLDGADLLSTAATVNIRRDEGKQVGQLTLVSGDQSINRLTGFGDVVLGANRLIIKNGGDFFGNITGDGTVDVESGDFTVSGELNSLNALFDVKKGSTTSVSNFAVLNVDRLVVDGTMVLQDGKTSMAHVTGQQATITGMLRGTGMISAPTIVHNGGQLSPGASPGHLLFDDLTLASGSTTTMELYLADANDAITVNAGGDLTIEGSAELVIVSDYQPSLGEVVRIFNFDNGAVKGVFGAVRTSQTGEAAADRVVFNLATGSAVGLGNRNLSALNDLPATRNASAIYEGLQVNVEGGVAQFYGGRFVENLTAAWAVNADTSDVFDRASPELYAGLSASAESAAMNSASDWVGGFVGKEGVSGSFFDSTQSNYSADDDGFEYKPFGVRSTNTNVGLNVSSSDVTVLFSFGIASTKLESDYLNGSGNGLVLGAALVGEFANSPGTVWTAGLRHASLSIDGQRVANNGLVGFSNVDASATQFNLGVEHNGSNGRTHYGVRGNLEFGSSKSDAFAEAAGLNILDAMAIDEIKNSYTRFNLGAKVEEEISAGTKLVGSFDLSVPLSSSLVGVGASYDGGQGRFGVNSRGLDAVSFAASIGVDQEISESGVISARIGAENTWNGDTGLSASLSARVNF